VRRDDRGTRRGKACASVRVYSSCRVRAHALVRNVRGFDHVYPRKDGGALKKAKVSEKPVDFCVQSL
jgi:hypothetical protein